MATFREPKPKPEAHREVIDLRDDQGTPADEPTLPSSPEAAERWLAVGPVTGSQARGAAMFGAVGALFGVGIGAIIAVIPISDWTYLARFVLFAAVCGFAGAVAGAVFGGGHEPEIEGDVEVDTRVADKPAPDMLRPAHIDEDMAHRTEDARHQSHHQSQRH